MPKNQDIEALRAYAIIITCVAHAGDMIPTLVPVLTYFRLGGGVDLFFCISGFVITRSLLNAAGRTRGGGFLAFALPFWVKRIFRLWPAAMLCAAVTVGCAYTFNTSMAFGRPEETAVTAGFGLAQLVNLRLVLCLNNGWLACHGDALWHYWSLSLEEQFYFIFPFLFFFLPRSVLVSVLCGMLLSQFFLERPWPSLLWFYRTDAIMFGILIALFESRRVFADLRRWATDRSRTTQIVSIIACILLVVLASPRVAFFFHGVLAVVAATLVLIAAFDASLTLAVARWRPCLAWIGARSYSIYLIHMPVYRLSREIAFRFWGAGTQSIAQAIVTVVIAVAITLAASEAMYVWVETPVRRVGRGVADRMDAVPAPLTP